MVTRLNKLWSGRIDWRAPRTTRRGWRSFVTTIVLMPSQTSWEHPIRHRLRKSAAGSIYNSMIALALRRPEPGAKRKRVHAEPQNSAFFAEVTISKVWRKSHVRFSIRNSEPLGAGDSDFRLS